jgi:DNA-binding response OmpR family regulator
MRVLLVEDDPSVAAGILDGLGTGFEVTHVTCGRDALSALGANPAGTAASVGSAASFDIVLLDLGLPDMDGTDVCRQIRSSSQLPVIVVSARGDEIDRVLSLEMGADDYVVKPFGMRELVARIRAVTRRTSSSPEPEPEPESSSETVRKLFGLTVDTRTQRVELGGEEIHLTPKEFELVVYLSADPGAVYRRQDILHDVWQTNWYGTSKTLDAHIAAIRKKFGAASWIESVRGVGFRFGGPE